MEGASMALIYELLCEIDNSARADRQRLVEIDEEVMKCRQAITDAQAANAQRRTRCAEFRQAAAAKRSELHSLASGVFFTSLARVHAAHGALQRAHAKYCAAPVAGALCAAPAADLPCSAAAGDFDREAREVLRHALWALVLGLPALTAAVEASARQRRSAETTVPALVPPRSGDAAGPEAAALDRPSVDEGGAAAAAAAPTAMKGPTTNARVAQIAMSIASHAEPADAQQPQQPQRKAPRRTMFRIQSA